VHIPEVFQGWWHPESLYGLVMVARRATDQAQPVIRRVGMALLPIALTAIVSAFFSLMGGWIALNARLSEIEKNASLVSAAMLNAKTLSDYQVANVQEDIKGLAGAIADLRKHQTELDLEMSRISTLSKR